MTAHEVLEKVANGMVAAGLYEDVATAIRAMALDQIERKIASYGEQIHEFEQKHKHNLGEYSCLLEGKASMEDEDEWMEWKGAVVMLEAWQRALQEVQNSA